MTASPHMFPRLYLRACISYHWHARTVVAQCNVCSFTDELASLKMAATMWTH